MLFDRRTHPVCPSVFIGLAFAWLALATGCEPPASPTAGAQTPQGAGAITAPQLAPRASALPTVVADAWRADRSPWTGFGVGSWAHYRLSDGTEERVWLEGKPGAFRLATQVRKAATLPWEQVTLRQAHTLDAWPLVEAMARSKPELGTASVTYHETLVVQATRVVVPGRVVIASGQVPGGLIQDARIGEDGQPVPERVLLDFGIAAP